MRISLIEALNYRLNFLISRFRNFVSLVTIYYFWSSIIQGRSELFGYQNSEILSYIFVSSIIATVIYSSKSVDIQNQVATGTLSNFLLRPINFIGYWFSRDFVEKMLNLSLGVIEIVVAYLILKPPIQFIQLDFTRSGFIVLSIIFSVVLYFLLSLIISLSCFWWYENGGWPQRFLFTLILTLFTGQLFPLEVFPTLIQSILVKLPTAFLVYFPTQIILDRVSNTTILYGLGVQVIYIWILMLLVNWIWNKGLKNNYAFGS